MYGGGLYHGGSASCVAGVVTGHSLSLSLSRPRRMDVTAQKAKVVPCALRSAYPDGPPRSVGAAGATCVGGVGVVGGRVGSVEGPVPISHLPPSLRLLDCFKSIKLPRIETRAVKDVILRVTSVT